MEIGWGAGERWKNFYRDVITTSFSFVLARRFDHPLSFVRPLCCTVSYSSSRYFLPVSVLVLTRRFSKSN